MRNHVVNVNPFAYGHALSGGRAMAASFLPGKLKKQSGPCRSVVEGRMFRSLTAWGGCENGEASAQVVVRYRIQTAGVRNRKDDGRKRATVANKVEMN